MTFDLLKSKLEFSTVITLLVAVIGTTSTAVVAVTKFQASQDNFARELIEVKTVVNDHTGDFNSRFEKIDARFDKVDANQQLLIQKMAPTRWTWNMEKDKTRDENRLDRFLTMDEVIVIHDRYQQPP